MKYIELLIALDMLSKYYPRYYSQELFLLAEDVLKWINGDLPEDSSTIVYLENCFGSPTEAFKSIWKDLQLTAGPLVNIN
jgi:hypothetical protein